MFKKFILRKSYLPICLFLSSLEKLPSMVSLISSSMDMAVSEFDSVDNFS